MSQAKRFGWIVLTAVCVATVAALFASTAKQRAAALERELGAPPLEMIETGDHPEDVSFRPATEEEASAVGR